jgi:hypothetical protein
VQRTDAVQAVNDADLRVRCLVLMQEVLPGCRKHSKGFASVSTRLA